MIENKIEIGDSVRHKTRHLSGGMPLAVDQVNCQMVLVSHFEGENAIHRKEWFNMDELVKIEYPSVS